MLGKAFRFSRYVLFGLTADLFLNCHVRVIRTAYFRLFVKKCGKNVYVGKHLDIKNPWNIEIGNNVIINKRVLLDGRRPLIIGNNVDIAQDAFIWTYQHDFNDDFHSGCGESTVIEDYAWICARSTILPGVTIGEGSVIATNAVVTKNIPPMVYMAEFQRA